MPRLLPPRPLAIPSLGALVLLGCSTAPLPVPALPPVLVARARYLPGEAWPAVASKPAPGAPWTVEVDACWLDRMPASSLAPLPERIRMIGSTAAADPVRTHTEMAGHGRIGGGEAAAALLRELDAGRLANAGPWFNLRVVARIGMRTRLELLEWSGTGTSAVPLGIACEIEPSGAGAQAELVVELSRAALVARDEDLWDPDPVKPDRPRVVELTRMRLLDPLPIGTEGLLLLLPAPDSGLVCALRLRGRAEAPDPEVLAAAEGELRAAALLARMEVEPLTADNRTVLTFENAVHALAEGHHQRSALVFLSQARPTPVASDLALAADPLLLLEWAAVVEGELLPLPRNAAPALAWTLERTALEALLRLIAQDALTTPLRAILLRNVGELGSAPDLLAAAVAESRDVASFQRRLTEENQAFLVDTRPAARARASDWLLARGQLPAGFDPLASPASRRAALEAWESAESGR